jgi:hypothetical protein
MKDTSSIQTREHLAQFVMQLRNDLINQDNKWENDDLISFLEALSAYLQDIPGYYKNNDIQIDPDECSWRLFADALLGARIYE